MGVVGPDRTRRFGCGFTVGFLLLVVVLAVGTTVVPSMIMSAPPERLPKAVLRWRNGGGFEIARGEVDGHPWVVHAAKRSRPLHRTCVYILHDTPEDRSDSLGDENNLNPARVTEATTCGLTPTADGSGLVGALGGSGFSRYQIPGTSEWLLFGVVPADVRTVTLAARGRRVTVDTIASADFAERFFVVQRAGFGPGRSSAEPATITGMVDTKGKRVRVYWS